jgi:hypothetical protein
MNTFSQKHALRALSLAGLFSLLCGTQAAESPYVAAQKAIELSSDRQLFIDDSLIESRSNLTRVLHQPVKEPVPVLVGDQPWEHWMTDVFGIPSIHFDAATGQYRLWYTAYAPGNQYYICYATSRDGRHWEKPRLGINQMDGSMANNIVNLGRVFWLNSTVLFDEHDPNPDRRYKSLSWDFGPSADGKTIPGHRPNANEELKKGRALGVSVAFSPDGIHWSLYDGNPVMKDTGDTNFILGWDPGRQKYLGYFRPSYEASGGARVIGFSTSTDFIHWTVPEIILRPDLQDPVTDEFYGMPVVRYQGKYIGFLWVYHNSPNPVLVPSPKSEELRGNQQKLDTQLEFSEDGQHFIRIGDRTPFMPAGAENAWDRGMVTVSDMVEHGDELWFYYGGWGVRHNGEDKTLGTIVEGQRRMAAVGLARLRLDGFVSLHGGPDEGVLLTRRIHLSGQHHLLINGDAKMGSISIELLNASGEPLPGFDRGRFRVIQKDAVRAEAQWRDQPNINSLSGQVVQIRIFVRNADIYSFVLE